MRPWPLRLTVALMLTVALAIGLAVLPRYQPPPGQLDDLTAQPDLTALRRAGVRHVSWAGVEGAPLARVVHLLDWHLVPPDLHALDAGQAGDSYEEHLAQVGRVQEEQVEVLRALAEWHGVRRVLVEGLTEEGRGAWEARVAALRETTGLQEELRGLLAQATRRQDKEAVGRIHGLIEQHRRDRLELGAVCQLQAEGGLVRGEPLEERDPLNAADPRLFGGKIDPGANAARDAAIVRRLLAAARPLAVIVLGGAHDLSDEIRRQGGGKVEYVRLSTASYQKLAGN